MKSLYYLLILLALTILPTACVDDTFLEESKDLPVDTNYKEFSEGYSIAFNISLDQLGGNIATRADVDDDWLQSLENYLDPEEFRVLFFGEDNKFLFESKSRWLTEIDAKSGNRCWRVGVPIFQYLSDEYQQEGSDMGEVSKDGAYNWNAIVEYMKTHNFKVCILANSPNFIKNLPELSDYASNTKGLHRYEWNADVFGLVGPFWTPKNSALTTLEDIKNWGTKDENDNDITSEEQREANEKTAIKTVFDLHHCQYDPFYDAKNHQGGSGGAYEHIIKYITDRRISVDQDVPYMGAYSSWLGEEKRYSSRDGKYILSQSEFEANKNPNGNYYYPNGKTSDQGTRIYENSFYRLPEDRLGKESVNRVNIPMFGIQTFGPLTDWTKGTTYNISEQTASQAKDYIYKSIFLLRSVVKLELRIPMYDPNGNLVKVDLNYTSLYHNNYLARREPMNVISPTDSIWTADHTSQCEWLRIKEYGPLVDNSVAGSNFDAFRNRLSWYHGVWKKQGYDFGKWVTSYPSDNIEPPHIFNPLVQRLQCAYISNNFLPIGISRDKFVNPNWNSADQESNLNNKTSVYELGYEYDHPVTYVDNNGQTKTENIKIPTTKAEADKYYNSTQGYYYRWVIYCGERYINDANTLGHLSSTTDSRGYVPFFRVPMERNNTTKTYMLPIVKYSKENAKTVGTALNTLLNSSDSNIPESSNVPTAIATYVDAVAALPDNSDFLPYPLLRNHFYRLTCSFGDGEDLNIQIIDSEERNVGDILFGRN